MPSQKIREHFMEHHRLFRIYRDNHDHDSYALMLRKGQKKTRVKDFDYLPVNSYIVNLTNGHYSAWRKLAMNLNQRSFESHDPMWQILPQWKADLLGLIAYPFLLDDYDK